MSRRLYARDMRGAEAADLEGSARSSAVAVAAPSLTTARHEPHVALMLGLQRTAGNQAVLGLLGVRSTRHSLAPASVVQRQDDDYEDAGSGWGGGEEAAPSESSSGESSAAGSEWSSGAADGGAGGGGGGEGGESWAPSEAPTTESPGGDDGGGSEWSGGGGAGGGDATGSESSGGGAGGGGGGEGGEGEGGGASGGESAGSEWSGGGESAGSGWSGGGGGEEASGGDDGGGSSWWPFGGDEESDEGEGGDEGDFSPEEILAKQEEGQIGPVSDQYVETSGGPTYGGSGFHDGGRHGTVQFRSERPEDHEDGFPRAITTGGRTGTRVWAGGGGAGPKMNQRTGSFSKQAIPKYDTDWGGIATFASAWVIPGTGIFDVHRDYMTSDAGDQGNGWWISSRAASALEAHEQRHLEAARSVYNSIIEPMLDRIAKSKSRGSHTAYLSSDAIAMLEKYIDWTRTIKKYEFEDALWNADKGQVDTEDVMSARYPRPQKGPRTIGGKQYDNYLIMNDEPDPT